MRSVEPMNERGSAFALATPNRRSGLQSGKKAVCGQKWSADQPRSPSRIRPDPYARPRFARNASTASRPQHGPKSPSSPAANSANPASVPKPAASDSEPRPRDRAIRRRCSHSETKRSYGLRRKVNVK